MTRLLDGVEYPRDIRDFSVEELNQLAAEIREEVISVVSEVGGHFASTLGAVDLTLALHYVFDTPDDRIVWDTGHQAYAHKLLCGRRNRLATIRQLGGLSGFLSRDESEYDVFGAGHAGTSISAGHLDRDLIVVLNDNEHFIDPRVGAVSSFLSKQLTTDLGVRLQKNLSALLKSLPRGENLKHMARKMRDSFLSLVTPGFLFESLGFQYVGPIDGHNITEMVTTLENVKKVDGPTLVHVMTKKGKGYAPAEAEPIKFHAVTPFHVLSGKAKKEKGPVPTYTDIFGQSLVRIAKANPKVVGITAAMGSGTGIDKLGREIPKRTYDVGIAEQHAVTFAAGMATEGYIPVVAIYSTFLQRGYDEILHDVCLQNLHVVFALDRGGLVGADGPTHHGVFDFSYLRPMPNVVVMAPKDENELQHMLATAVQHGGPIALRYPRGEGWGVTLDTEMKQLEIGKAELLREGSDIVIAAIGHTVMPALKAAQDLAPLGINAAVVNARFVKPLDKDLLGALLLRVPRLLTVEDHVIAGGFGSAVIEFLADEGITGVEVRRLGVPDRFIPHGTQDELRKMCGFDKDAIAQTVLQMVRRGKKRSREGWERGSA